MENDQDSFRKAKEWALQRLNRREVSAADMLRFLRYTKKIDSEVAFRVVTRLKELGLINDKRYGRLLVREQALRGKGPHTILRKLKEKGISMDANRVQEFSEEATEKTQLQQAFEIVRRRYPSALPKSQNESERRRAFQALIRRGFSYSVAREALAMSLEPESSDALIEGDVDETAGDLD